MKEKFHYIKVVKDLSEEQVENGIEVQGYRPHFLINGTFSVFIDDLPFNPGEQWTENVPHNAEFRHRYNILFDTDYAVPTSNINAANGQYIQGLTLKQGKFVKITYYVKVWE